MRRVRCNTPTRRPFLRILTSIRQKPRRNVHVLHTSSLVRLISQNSVGLFVGVDSFENAKSESRMMRRFFVIWSAQASSIIGSQLVQFALVWWLTIETGSATVLAFATMMALIPVIVVGPFVGPLVDRWNRRWVMIFSDASIAAATMVIVLLFSLDIVDVWHIYVLMFVRGSGGAFHFPAMMASTSLMVTKKHLARVGGMNQALSGAVNIVAPPIAALLIVLMPMYAILSIDVVTALIAITPLLFLKIPQPVRRAEATEKLTVIDDMRAGFRFLRSWKGAGVLIVMVMIVNLVLTPTMSLTPLLITSHFGLGVEEFALFEAVEGLSLLLGGISLGIWGGFKKKAVTMLFAGPMAGLGTMAVGLCPSDAFYIALIGIFSAGFMIALVNGSAQALMQATIPPDMQGRVFSLVMSGSAAMAPIGLAVAGPVADAFGVPIWYVAAGVTLTVVMACGFLIPSLLRMEDTVGWNASIEEL